MGQACFIRVARSILRGASALLLRGGASRFTIGFTGWVRVLVL